MQAGFLSDVIAYMGTSDMRFLAPVYPGDAVHVETEITANHLTSKSWMCEYDWSIRNQDDEAVAIGHNI